jgi:hypothetical protein
MAIRWEDVRYRGDARDVEELMTTYRIGDYLQAFEENRRQVDQGIRERLMKEGIRLTERLSPRIFRLFQDLCRALDIDAYPEVFCLPSQEINAFAVLDVRKEKTWSLVGVTAAALERLEDAELKSILGHELGHILFGNNRLSALISTDAGNPALTVLPAWASLFLRWRKKARSARIARACSRAAISCDGHLAAEGDVRPERKNLNLDIQALIGRWTDPRRRELMEETSRRTAPAHRLKAVSSSPAPANRGRLQARRGARARTLEQQVDDLVRDAATRAGDRPGGDARRGARQRDASAAKRGDRGEDPRADPPPLVHGQAGRIVTDRASSTRSCRGGSAARTARSPTNQGLHPLASPMSRWPMARSWTRRAPSS